MKLLALTHEFAGKPMVRLTWGTEGLFFADPQPHLGTMIAIDMPGLRSSGGDAVRDWLKEHHQTTELVQQVWRKAVLDDLLDATNATAMSWHLATHFTLAELTEFAEKHAPTLHTQVRAALAAAERKKQRTALRTLKKSAERIVPAFSAGVQRIEQDALGLELRDDHDKIERLGAFDAKTWIDTGASLTHDTSKRDLLDKIALQLVATQADIPTALDLMIEHKLDRIWAPQFWSTLANHVALAQNLHGEAIDMTKAREVTVPLTWDVWKAGRVGAIKFGRAALAVASGNRTIYVRGQRKLLHAIRARGGSLMRYGCTLVIGGKGPASTQAKLLEVDRIDTLAHVDPRGAAHLAGELPPGDPIAAALGHALGDPKWRRVLADLLVERLVGIDADVARRLARAEAGANRRRRR